MTEAIVPIVMCLVMSYALYKGVPVFDTFISGAKGGISTCFRILASLVALMTGVSMLSASGALDILTHAVRPLTELLQIPSEVVPLALLRPISGSGSLAMVEQMITTYGADSLIGRIASVMQGSTETTFYTLAVYIGATRVKRTGCTLPAALTTDFVNFLVSALSVKLLLG